jgi:hypothetical protein
MTNFKTIKLDVADVDHIIINELMESYERNNKFDKVDCSDDILEPDYKLLDAILTVLEYYMPPKEFEAWANYVHQDKEEEPI